MFLARIRLIIACVLFLTLGLGLDLGHGTCFQFQDEAHEVWKRYLVLDHKGTSSVNSNSNFCLFSNSQMYQREFRHARHVSVVDLHYGIEKYTKVEISIEESDDAKQIDQYLCKQPRLTKLRVD